MHNIEPAHHAVQQEVDWIGRRKSKQPITRFVRVRGEIRWGENMVNISWTHSSVIGKVEAVN